MTMESGRAPSGNRLSQAEPVSRLGASRFDPARIGDLPERLFARSLESLEALDDDLFKAIQDGAEMLAEIRNEAGLRP